LVLKLAKQSIGEDRLANNHSRGGSRYSPTDRLFAAWSCCAHGLSGWRNVNRWAVSEIILAIAFLQWRGLQAERSLHGDAMSSDVD
jgi:hypothetical protein